MLSLFIQCLKSLFSLCLTKIQRSLKMRNFDLIKKGIESKLKLGHRKFVIFPYGDIGMLTQDILNRCYGIRESFIIDNFLSIYNKQIRNLDYIKGIDCTKYTFLIATTNDDIHDDLIISLEKYVPIDNIVDLIPKEQYNLTSCGKYSYGPLCNHWLVRKVGSFCSFAPGTSVVQNHPIRYVSTHPFLYYGSQASDIYNPYNEYNAAPWYFPNVEPKGKQHKFNKITIGNDVWLGEKVIITNGANIGNGVIAAAGAVITKDVPDYAVVAGVPARIVRFRYTYEQIEKLNIIKWWNWSDEKIKHCYSDFYDSIEHFIDKHYKSYESHS